MSQARISRRWLVGMGSTAGLLHYWRKRAKAAGSRSGDDAGAAIYPGHDRQGERDGPSRRPPLARPRLDRHRRGRMIEIETAGARVRVPEGVDAKTLSVVLAALRRAS